MRLPQRTSVLEAARVAITRIAFTNLFVNDVEQSNGTCIRMSNTSQASIYPVSTLSSVEMACGVGGTTSVEHICNITQAANLTFVWPENGDEAQLGAINAPQKGPCAVFMKAVDSAINDKASGVGWFKIWESGYDNKTQKWCTEELIANNGSLSVSIPPNLAGGSYLITPQVLSLKRGNKNSSDPRIYTGCGQVFLESESNTVPTVSIPGNVNATDPPVTSDVYNPTWPYRMPGPAHDSEGTGTANEVMASDTAILSEGKVTAQRYSSAFPVLPRQYDPDEVIPLPPIILTVTSTLTATPSTPGTTIAEQSPSASPFQPGSVKSNLNITYCTPPIMNLPVSPNAACGAISGFTCIGNGSGSCCSQYGWCGSTPAHCGDGCQSAYGLCAMQNTTCELSATSTSETTSASSILTTTSLTVTITASTTSTSETTSGSPIPTATSLGATTTTSVPPSAQSSLAYILGEFRKTKIQIITPSTDGHCGVSDDTQGQTCVGTPFGNCCSQYGWCGSSNAYCIDGCQSQFGSCSIFDMD